MMNDNDLRFVSDGYNVILDTESEMYYEAFDKKSAEKLLKLLNGLENERVFYKQKTDNFKKIYSKLTDEK